MKRVYLCLHVSLSLSLCLCLCLSISPNPFIFGRIRECHGDWRVGRNVILSRSY